MRGELKENNSVASLMYTLTFKHFKTYFNAYKSNVIENLHLLFVDKHNFRLASELFFDIVSVFFIIIFCLLLQHFHHFLRLFNSAGVLKEFLRKIKSAGIRKAND